MTFFVVTFFSMVLFIIEREIVETLSTLCSSLRSNVVVSCVILSFLFFSVRFSFSMAFIS